MNSMEVDDKCESDEEEILVYAEFEDSVNIGKYRSIHVLGVNEKKPLFQMDDTFFTGKYEYPLGTYLFFEEDSEPLCQDPLFDKLPEKNLKYLCKTQKLLKMEHAYVTPKEGTEQDLQNQLQQKNDDIEPVNFKNIQEALNKFQTGFIPNCDNLKSHVIDPKRSTIVKGEIVRSIKPILSLRKPSFSTDISSEKDIADLITAKGYLPIESELPKSSHIKAADIDATFLLSKLSDTELIKLLSQQPLKNEYDLNDIVKIALDSDSAQANKLASNIDHLKDLSKGSKVTSNSVSGNILTEKSRINAGTDNLNAQVAFFRLKNKKVDPYSAKNNGDLKYVALQKLNNILYSRPLEHIAEDGNADEDEKKELLFDVLVAQLKTLCCKNTKNTDNKAPQYKSVLDFSDGDGLKKLLVHGQPSSHIAAVTTETTEHMFLIVNDEVKNNGSEDLISVDPDSLDGNSSVLLLGPITSPLLDGQLKLVMNRLTKELSKPEYVPLLQQLANGSLSDKNFRLMDSLITGPATRRYIKPHRCNHQSRLAKVYGGPKWIICTGYLNLNTPSLYD